MDHHNKGNQHAKKEVTKSVSLSTRCTLSQATLIISVVREGETHSQFLLDAAMKEVERRLDKEDL